jgi:hypothetical protein
LLLRNPKGSPWVGENATWLGLCYVTNCQADICNLKEQQRAAAGMYTSYTDLVYWLRGASRHNRLYASTRL